MPSSLSPCPQSEESVDQPLRALVEQVRSVLRDGPSAGESRITRCCVPVAEPVDPIRWLRAQDAKALVYWSGRSPDAVGTNGHLAPNRGLGLEGGPAVAGIGRADVLTSTGRPLDYGRLKHRLRDRFARADTAIRYFGGLRFDASQPRPAREPDDPWRSFGTYRFVLPRFELLKDGDRQLLACNLVLPRDRDQTEALLASIRGLAAPAPSDDGPLPAPTRRRDRPDEEGWTEMVRWALDAIDAGALDKVVFARQVSLGLDRPADPLRVLHHLQATTPGCFHFAHRPASGPTFVGATPERLFRRSGGKVVSEAVAGTRKRGDTPEADAALRDELLSSAKERREHAFVQRAIERDLAVLCTSVEAADAPSDLALARGRHLHAAVQGTLRPGAATVDLLEALHPTPAVGGVPTDAALSAIREQEPFDRGWYAGPVGWIGPDAADFAVAIRSGLLRPSQLALFSGAGIVEGSAPEREWAEIEQKIGDFAAVLGLLGHQDGTRS